MDNLTLIRNEILQIIGKNYGVVPSKDLAVRLHLRLRGEPTALFGEDEHDRRTRLAKLFDKPININLTDTHEEKSKRFYTKSNDDLLMMRKKIHNNAMNACSFLNEEHRFKLYSFLVNNDTTNFRMELLETMNASERPIRAINCIKDNIIVGTLNSSILYVKYGNPNSKIIIPVSAYTNDIKIITKCDNTHLIFSSHGNGFIDINEINNQREINNRAILNQHELRCNRLDIQEYNMLLSSCSHDETVRIWDINTSKELLLQEGHESPVYDCKFNSIEGCLLSSIDLNGICKLWDLRSGKNILNIKAVNGQGLCICWHPQIPWYFLTSGSDGAIRLWDIRNMDKYLTKNPADGGAIENTAANNIVLNHTRSIRTACFEPNYGRYIASFDTTGKMNITNMKTLLNTSSIYINSKLPNCFCMHDNYLYSSFEGTLINKYTFV